jgi:hypothetical protein
MAKMLQQRRALTFTAQEHAQWECNWVGRQVEGAVPDNACSRAATRVENARLRSTADHHGMSETHALVHQGAHPARDLLDPQ